MTEKETFGDIVAHRSVQEPKEPELNEFPWDRLPDESTKHYELFCFFRDYGPTRSYTSVQKKYSGVEFDLTPSTLRSYGKKHDWIRRAEAFDDHIMKQELAQNEKLIKKYKAKQAKRAQKMMDRYFEMMEEDDTTLLTAREKRERFKMAHEIFSDIFQLDKKKEVEHSGSVTIVFGDEVKDV
jgi:hypothetical protein